MRRGLTIVVLLVGVMFLLVAVGCLLFAFGALQNLWTHEGDSAPGFYIVVGSVSIVVAAGAGLAGITILRRKRPSG